MSSPSTIPLSELRVNDNMAIIDNLRPNAGTAMTSSYPTVIIEYTPKIPVSVQAVNLLSPENIKTYTVTFYNTNGIIINATVSIG